jgi:hypothetical protein
MRHIGFSTGALARNDFDRALLELAPKPVDSVELSALRFPELRILLESIPRLQLERYRYISLHAPSHFEIGEEEVAIAMLQDLAPPLWPIVIHPDSIRLHDRWMGFGSRLAVENMDRRKSTGRSAQELVQVFARLPDASLCFDIGHARQFDTTMTEAYMILKLFAGRLCQLHVSEVNSASQHERLSFSAIRAFEQVADLVPDNIPLIIESRVSPLEIDIEITSVNRSIPLRTAALMQA